jgi:hypothetical protein
VTAALLAFAAGVLFALLVSRALVATYAPTVMKGARVAALKDGACRACGRLASECSCPFCGTPCVQCYQHGGRGPHVESHVELTNAILKERSSVVVWLRSMGKAQELIDPGLPEMLNTYADLIAKGEHLLRQHQPPRPIPAPK